MNETTGVLTGNAGGTLGHQCQATSTVKAKAPAGVLTGDKSFTPNTYSGTVTLIDIQDPTTIELADPSTKNLTQRFFVEKLRVYVSGQNLWTSTNYSGYNPEVNARPSNSLSPGEDYGTYPLAKTFLFGLNITL